VKMDWGIGLALLSVIVLVLAHFLHQRSLQKLLASSGGRIGLIVAHPDDESFFFVPSLASIVSVMKGSGDCSFSILCLSNGNAENLGKIREDELAKAAKILGIGVDKIEIKDDSRLVDGMKTKWDLEVAESYIKQFIAKHDIRTLITFDDYGVSGHGNHIACYQAVRRLVTLNNSDLIGYRLISTNIIRKFFSVFDVPFSVLESSLFDDVLFFHTPNPLLSYKAMAAHASQWTLQRRVFVFFSRYTFLNTLKRIK